MDSEETQLATVTLITWVKISAVKTGGDSWNNIFKLYIGYLSHLSSFSFKCVLKEEFCRNYAIIFYKNSYVVMSLAS